MAPSCPVHSEMPNGDGPEHAVEPGHRSGTQAPEAMHVMHVIDSRQRYHRVVSNPTSPDAPREYESRTHTCH